MAVQGTLSRIHLNNFKQSVLLVFMFVASTIWLVYSLFNGEIRESLIEPKQTILYNYWKIVKRLYKEGWTNYQ